MKKRLGGVLGALLLAGCYGPPAAEPESIMPQPWVAPPRVYALLGQRAELNLTSEQVAALDSIGVALAEENAPLVARARELQGADGRRQRMTEERAEMLRPVLREIRDNNQAAMNRVQEILAEAQERRVCEVFSRPRSAREEARLREREERARRERRRRPDVEAADTTEVFGGRAAIWPWCRPQPATQDTTPAAVPDTVPPDTTSRHRR